MKKVIKEYINQDYEFLNIIEELIKNETVQEMKKYRQHYETTCYEHCLLVSYYCYIICKKYNLDYISAARAAMLHDLFLYDWRQRQPDRKGLHAFTHGKVACNNACKLFDLNKKEKDIIIKHMWPVTVSFPTSPEGFILTFVDKYCAMSETFDEIKSRIIQRKIYIYLHTFMNFIRTNIAI